MSNRFPAEASKGHIDRNGTCTTRVAANLQVPGVLVRAYGCFGGIPDVRSGSVRLASPHAGHWAPIYALHMIGGPTTGNVRQSRPRLDCQDCGHVIKMTFNGLLPHTCRCFGIDSNRFLDICFRFPKAYAFTDKCFLNSIGVGSSSSVSDTSRICLAQKLSCSLTNNSISVFLYSYWISSLWCRLCISSRRWRACFQPGHQLQFCLRRERTFKWKGRPVR